MPTTTAAILLAAGRSSRMGQGKHKLLLPLGDRPVVAHVVETLLASQACPIVVITGYQAEELQTILAPYASKLTVVENPDYQQGMSTSLRPGIETLMSSYSTVNGALIVLGDQPLMTPAIIDSMIAAKRTTSKRIITAHYSGKRGNPTLFDASLFPELIEMTGDEGGRKVLERHREEIAMVDMKEDMANYDVDTWEAYQQVVRIWKSHT